MTDPEERTPADRIDATRQVALSLMRLLEAIRVPSGLNATLYTSGYVECAYGGFGDCSAAATKSGFVIRCPPVNRWFARRNTAMSTGSEQGFHSFPDGGVIVRSSGQ